MKNTFFTYEILEKEIKIIEESKESNDSFNTINEIVKQLRLEGYNQEIIFNGERVKDEKIFVKLDYYDQKNHTDPRSVLKRHEIIEGINDFEIFEKFYKLNNRLKYCNGAYYVFNKTEWAEKYYEWRQSDDYKSKSFNLFYGGGVVD